MTLKYEPKKILRKLKLKAKAEKLVTQNLTVNRAAVKSLTNAGVLPKKQLETVAIKVINAYKKKVKKELKEGSTKKAAKEDALNDKKQMVARIQSAVLNEQTNTIKKAYRGEYYVWLPSSAANPDELHKKKYGKRFQLGKGEAPGDRYGCQCGMEILVDETPSQTRGRLEEIF